MLFQVIALLSIIACSDGQFDSNIDSSEPEPPRTGDVREETSTTTEVLPVEEDIVIASKTWSFSGLPLKNETAERTGNTQTTPMTMTRISTPEDTELTQIDRRITRQKKQQQTEQTVSGEFPYTLANEIAERPLDILLVIDNSGSIINIRKEVGKRLHSLLNHIEDSDWKLAVTSTYFGHCLETDWIINQTNQGTFNDVVNNKILCPENNEYIDKYAHCKRCSVDERPLLMAVNGLGGNLSVDNTNNEENRTCVHACGGKKNLTTPNNWLRADSMIAVILVTDEYNAGTYGDKIDAIEDKLTDHLEKTLQRQKGINYKIYGILCSSERNQRKAEGCNKKPWGYSIVDPTDRKDIEDDNYDTLLSKISAGIMEILNRTLDISALARGKKSFAITKVMKNSSLLSANYYSYNHAQKKITFTESADLNKNSKIVVHYTHLEESGWETITLTYLPVSGSLAISPTNCGNWQPTHTLSGKTITFNSKPPTGCTVGYSYKRSDRRLRNTMTLNRPDNNCKIDNNSIKVTVDGQPRTKGLFNSATNRLSFVPNNSDDGKLTKTDYNCLTDKISYRYSKTGDGTISCGSAKGRNDIRCSFSTRGNQQRGVVTIMNKNDFALNKKFYINEPLDPQDNSIPLLAGYLPKSLSVTIIKENPRSESICDHQLLQVINNEILLNKDGGCNSLGQKQGATIILSYQRQQEHLFEIGNDFFNANHYKDEQWRVVVDGTELASDAYELDKEARTVKLTSPPTPDAKIEIKVDLLW